MTKSGSIANHIIMGGIPEEFEVHILKFFLPHIRCFLDVGANTALYGFVVANDGLPEAEIHCFEPQADRCKIMNKTVYLNNWEEKVMIHNIGLGDMTAKLTLHLSGTGSTFDNAFNDNAVLPTGSVYVDTLDNLALKLGLDKKVDFIKIDVEGFEQKVLKGGEKIILRDKPVLFIEIADMVRGKTYRNPGYSKTLHWLSSNGYRVFKCTQGGHLVEAMPDQEHDHKAMYLALHVKSHKQWILPINNWTKKYRRQKRNANYKRYAGLIIKGIRHPKRAAGKLLNILARNKQTDIDSWKRHDMEYAEKGSAEKHQIIYAGYDEENLANNRETRLEDLIMKQPHVRGVAVDIGCGGGYFSAWMHKKGFFKVIAIEPSESAINNIAKELFPALEYPNIDWQISFAEDILLTLDLKEPALFFSGCTLSHLTDNSVAKICAAINQIAPKGYPIQKPR